MNEIIPARHLTAEVSLPGSKSYTNRALIIAALADGTSKLTNVLKSDDTRAMADAIRAFDIQVEEDDVSYTVHGKSGKLTAPQSPIDMQHSGTGARLVCALAALAPGRTVVTGSARLQERPFGELINGLQQLGGTLSSINQTGSVPVAIEGGSLPGGTCTINGTVSSQFFTALLLIAPYAERDVCITVTGEQTSKPYIDLTIDIMNSFGVQVHNHDYQSQAYTVECDASSASYFMAIAALTQSTIRINGFNPQSIQGDADFALVMESMGCRITRGETWIEISGPDELQAIEKEMNRMPDTVQTLAVVAACAKGITKITNVANLRVKETDRLQATTAELRKTGIQVEELDDGLIIHGGESHAAEIETYNDHRMAMAFACLGTNTSGIRIKNPEVVTKSFPDFWKKLADIDIKVK